ncbi:SGNH/GDSL hydrolase family protein [Streptomyces collinus]
MRHSRTASYAASLLLAAAGALAGPATAEPAPRTTATGYVALGDSYSAGVGAGDYLGSDAGCLRSGRAFPALWAAAHRPSSFAFTACNGARTKDVLAGQLGPLGPRTGLVSITVGGSDAGFGRVMATCVIPGRTACLSAITGALSYVDGTLAGDLDRLYAAIRVKAPAARVVVLGYPHFYRLHGTCAGGLQDAERSALNAAVDHLDNVIARHALDHGFVYADPRTTFAGHEICSAGPWLRSVTWTDLTESYHPTAPGQALGYLPLFAGAAV